MAQPSFRTKLTEVPGEKLPSPTSLLAPLAAWRSWVPQAIVIAAAAAWIYAPSIRGGFLWDDLPYIRENPIIHNPAGFINVWFHLDGQQDYYPLTSFAWWIEWQHFGRSTTGYHLVNVALHLVSAFLVWNLLWRIGVRSAWLGALIFAVHPAIVESVAWISELKNTLSLPLLLLSMICWLEWKGGAPNRFYRWSLLCFVFSLLAKTVGLMLPFIFLGYAWATRGRIERKDWGDVAPFLVISVVAVVATAPPHGMLPNAGSHVWTLAGALAAVGWSLTLLAGKCIWPVDLLPVYSGYADEGHSLLDFLPWLGFGGLFVLIWRGRSGWAREIFLGVGFFLINLVPVLGFVFLRYTFMFWSMDHLVYLPIIGLIGLVVAGIGRLQLVSAAPMRLVGNALMLVVVGLMAWKAHAYSGWFESASTLWGRTLQREPDSWLAQQDYACALTNPAEATPHFLRALELNPYDDGAMLPLGQIAMVKGDTDTAESYFRHAAKVAPDTLAPFIELGGLLLHQGRTAEAIECYRKAVAIAPERAEVQYDLGNAQLQGGNLPGAVEHLGRSERLDPKIETTHENLGVALARSGRIEEAIAEFQVAAQLQPDKLSVRNNLGLALLQSGHISQAMVQFKEALRIDPGNAEARDMLAKAQQAGPKP